MEQKLREILGLAEGEDVVEAVQELKDREKKATMKLSEHEQIMTEFSRVKADIKTLTDQRDELVKRLAERDRDEAIKSAIVRGKITPSQTDWARDYALRDPEGFKAFVDAAPVIVDLKERGIAGDIPTGLSSLEIELAQQLGVTKEQLLKAKESLKKGR